MVVEDSSHVLSDQFGVKQFYDGQSIFITGGTGFLGKVLVEKLLRSCPSIKQIYLLVRPKYNKCIWTRLEDFKKSPAFQLLRKSNPQVFEKLVPISGDVTLPGLGISPTDEVLLKKNVAVVFHSAATVKFDENLRDAVDKNLIGTMKVTKLCEDIPGLRVLVHVSTAYSHCIRQQIDEKFYPTDDPFELIKTMESMDDKIMSKETLKILGNHPNTYTYTKGVTETYLLKHCPNLPIAIIRPSIIIAAWKEPFPGWVDNLSGANGIYAAAETRFLKVIYMPKITQCDLIPVDVVANTMIGAAWLTVTDRCKDHRIFNCTVGSHNPVSIGKLVEKFNMYTTRNCFEIFLNSQLRFTSSRLHHYIYTRFVQLLLAYIIDTFLFLTGGRAICAKIQKKTTEAMGVLEYFMIRQWKFCDKNMWHLWNTMSLEDRKDFCLDIRGLQWDTFLKTQLEGIKNHINQHRRPSSLESHPTVKKLFMCASYLVGVYSTCKFLKKFIKRV